MPAALRRDAELGLIEISETDTISVRRFSGKHSAWYSDDADGGEGGTLFGIHVDRNGPVISDPLDAVVLG